MFVDVFFFLIENYKDKNNDQYDNHFNKFIQLQLKKLGERLIVIRQMKMANE